MAGVTEEGVREGLASVTKGTLLLMVGTLGFIAENFVSRVILVRVLSPYEWSEFSLGLALLVILTSVGTLGFSLAVPRSLPFSRSDPERRSIVRASLAIVGASSVVVGAGLYLAGDAIGRAVGAPLLGVTIHFFSFAISFTILSQFLAAIFQGYEDVRPNAVFVYILNPLLFVLFLGGALALGSHRVSYDFALDAYAAAAGITLGLLGLYTWLRLPKLLPPGPTAPHVVPNLVRLAAPLFAVNVMVFVTGYGDTLVLGIFHNSAVGTYSASVTLARLLQLGITSLGYIFLPVTAKFLRNGDVESVRITYATATKWMVLASLPLFLLFFFLPGPSLSLVWGSGYSLVTRPLEILSLGAFLSTLMGPSVWGQVAFGQTRLLFYNSIAAGAADIGLAFVLVPAYGMTGAAVAWATANTLQPLLAMAQLAVLEDVHPFRRDFVVPLAATGLPLGVALYLLRVPVPFWILPPAAVGIAGLFLLAVVLTGSIDRGDQLLLEAVERIAGRPIPFVRRLGRWRAREALG